MASGKKYYAYDVSDYFYSAQSTRRIEELLQEDQNVKRRRERYQKQSSLLSKLTRQLSIHDNRAAASSNWSNGDTGTGMVKLTKGKIIDLLCSMHILLTSIKTI